MPTMRTNVSMWHRIIHLGNKKNKIRIESINKRDQLQLIKFSQLMKILNTIYKFIEPIKEEIPFKVC